MQTQTLTIEQMQAQLTALMEANAKLERKLKAKANGTIKVSEKGAVSVYGLGRFPVTLYASQWEALFDRQEEVKEFILDNVDALAKKEA